MRTSYMLVGGPGHATLVTLDEALPWLHFQPQVALGSYSSGDAYYGKDFEVSVYERVLLDEPVAHGPAYEYRFVPQEEAANSSG